VVAQVAISFVLLIGAGLMMRSFLKIQQVQPGFQTDHLLTLRFSPNFGRLDPAERALFPKKVLDRIRALSGVESAGLTSNPPFNPGVQPGVAPIEIEGRPASKGELAPTVDFTIVSPGYFSTLRQPIIKGRDFNERDDANAPIVVVINQALARHRFANEDPIGKRLYIPGPNRWVTIVGIAADAKEYSLDRPVLDEVYQNSFQRGFANTLVIRTTVNPTVLIPMVRSAIHDVYSQTAVDRVSTVERLQYESMASPRVMTILLGIFAALALLISASGIAAVMALSVSQRTRELGIRMALGASRGGIVGMVVRQGLVLAMIGTLLGIGGAAALTQFLSTLLYATSPADILTFAAVSLLFLSVAAIACFVPARQVTSIDPLIALRQE
jgi:predicted permease